MRGRVIKTPNTHPRAVLLAPPPPGPSLLTLHCLPRVRTRGRHQMGERLGFCMTLVLTVEFGKMIFHEQLPICGELLWIELFNTTCLVFCYISLAETILVLYLAFHDEDSLLPKWMVDLFVAVGLMSQAMDMRIANQVITGKRADHELTAEELNFESSAGLLFRIYNSVVLTNAEAEQVRSKPPRPAAVAGDGAQNGSQLKRGTSILQVAATPPPSPPGPSARDDEYGGEGALFLGRKKNGEGAVGIAPPAQANAARGSSMVAMREEATMSPAHSSQMQRGLSVGQYRQTDGNMTPSAAETANFVDSELALKRSGGSAAPPDPKLSFGRSGRRRRSQEPAPAPASDFAQLVGVAHDVGDAHGQGGGNGHGPSEPRAGSTWCAAAMERVRAAKSPSASPAASRPPMQASTRLRWMRDDNGMLRPTRALNSDDVARLVFFENLYFKLDVYKNGYLSIDESTKALSYLATSMSYQDRLPMMLAVDDGDGKLQRWEWVELCVNAIWDYPTAQLEMAAENYCHAYSYKLEANKHRWRAIGRTIDAYARFWVITIYCAVFGLLFGMELGDPYGVGQPSRFEGLFRPQDMQAVLRGEDMFYGVYRMIFQSDGIVIALIAPFFLCILAILYILAMCFNSRRALHEQGSKYARQVANVMDGAVFQSSFGCSHSSGRSTGEQQNVLRNLPGHLRDTAAGGSDLRT